jgi:hypothetical protein
MPDFMRRGQDLDDLYAEVIASKACNHMHCMERWRQGGIAIAVLLIDLACIGRVSMASMLGCGWGVQARCLHGAVDMPHVPLAISQRAHDNCFGLHWVWFVADGPAGLPYSD